MRFIYIADTEEHARKLKSGLENLDSSFIAELCGVCQGEGRYNQTYTAGCGGGYFKSKGECDYCQCTGLVIGSKPAPESVMNQVLNAATESVT